MREVMIKEKGTNQYSRIYHSYSEKFSGIQHADLLAWVIFQRYNNNDPSYFGKINTSTFRQSIIKY